MCRVSHLPHFILYFIHKIQIKHLVLFDGFFWDSDSMKEKKSQTTTFYILNNNYILNKLLNPQ